jgi:hypothetical protein
VVGYHPNHNINAPRYNNVNVNINNNNINNVNRQKVNTGGRTQRPTNASSAGMRNGQANRSGVGTARSQSAGNVNRGRTQPASIGTASPARQMERGSNTSAFSGYQKGSSEKTASTRGRKSARSKPSRDRRK